MREMHRKKILLLGGSAQQITAIETARKLGYYTVLCDFLPDNPGQFHADKFYLISTTDKEAVLEAARNEKVDGVLAYASDPAAPVAAYVAEKMGLPGNPYESVKILCNKDSFRKFLSENGFHGPEAHGYSDSGEALADKGKWRYPLIIKPVDSSGSKGVTVLHSENGIKEALDYAFSFSCCHRIIIEDFITKKHPYLTGGDIFVSEGEIILWGLLNCHRDSQVNPLVPVGKSYPLCLDRADEEHVKGTLTKLVHKLGIRDGAMNVELIIDKNNHVWPVDIGPRAGGNMIPELLEMIFGADVVEMAVLAAMGESIKTKIHKGRPYYATHNLHSSKSGFYENIEFSPELESHIVKKCLYKKTGDKVEFFDNASKALGILFMKFDSWEEMQKMLLQINEHITIKLKSIGGGGYRIPVIPKRSAACRHFAKEAAA
ncbi:carbamoyl-phosphate synthase large chain [Lachnospiraceae bacterium]|nr:carbamoyl-phosphate synthase large chain [Lachnospiraceae bacterium]